MKLDEILGNAELGDDMEITLGDKGSFKLGDLRGQMNGLRSERDAIATERDTFRGERDKLNTSVSELLAKAGQMADTDAGRQPADPRQVLREALTPLLQGNDPSQALFDDKIFGNAFKTVEERAYGRTKAEIDAANKGLSELRELVTQGFQNLAQAQVAQRDVGWYGDHRSEIPAGVDGKKLGLQDIQKFASDRSMFIPGTRLLDLDRALDTLTEPARVEARMTEAEKRGYQKGLEAGRKASASVIPMFGDRSGGAVGKGDYSTAGKSARQILSERIAQGLADEFAANEG